MLSQPYARRATRRAVDMTCEIVSPWWDEPVSHRLADLSLFGVWIDTSFPLPVGERVALSFAPPRRPEMTVFAEVRRVRPNRTGRRGGMALEFLDLERRERHDLGRALRRV
jgi:hypothetical protein